MSEAKAGRGKRNRLAVLMAALWVALVVVMVGSLAQSQATTGTNPYEVPEVVDTNPDPNIVETTIAAQRGRPSTSATASRRTRLDLQRQRSRPEFRLKVGDTVIVHFENNLDAPELGHPLARHRAQRTRWTARRSRRTRSPPGGELPLQVRGHPARDLLVPPAPPLLDQPGLQGPVRDDHRRGSERGGAGRQRHAAARGQTRPLVLSDITVCKTPGRTTTATYAPTLPHVSGGPLSHRRSRRPRRRRCARHRRRSTRTAMRRWPAFAAGDIPNIQTAGTTGRVNEGQTVLTNGMNVGAPARDRPYRAPGALAPGAPAPDVQAGQGLRLQIVNAATTRYHAPAPDRQARARRCRSSGSAARAA